jgi:hypothetical protein
MRGLCGDEQDTSLIRLRFLGRKADFDAAAEAIEIME